MLPVLSHKKIDKIKSLHIVDFIDALSKGRSGGLGDQTIRDIFKILQE
ncbi:hypothetical protein [Bacillus atrophaeus]